MYACVHAKETRAAELSSPMEEFQAVAYICGYHVFKDVWKAPLGKESMCERSHTTNNIAM